MSGEAPVAPGPAAVSAWASAPWWRRGLRNGVVLGALALAAILLLNREDLSAVGMVLAALPAALAISLAVHLPQMLATALAWRVLLPAPLRPSAAAMMVLRWYRESANALLPAGALVGQAAAARLLARRGGVPGELAGATATVDFTVEAASQLAFTLSGIALLVAGGGIGTWAAIGAVALGVGAVGGMVAVQRRLPLGVMERGLARLARRWPALQPAWIGNFHQAMLRLHAERGALAAAMLWHGLAWALGAVVAAAALVGVPPGAALTAALVRRAREVLLAVPGLIAWRRSELAGAKGTA